MPVWLTDAEYRTLSALCARLVPPDEAPGADGLGAPDYIDQLLGAFTFDPPRVWAGGPVSGRHGGERGFAAFLSLSPLEELAWRMRIEGSAGRTEREFNGPVTGLQERYRSGLAALGADFAGLGPDAQEARIESDEEFADLVYGHCCEALYGAPEYGGNRHGQGWALIGFAGDVQPRGYDDDEVAGR